MGNKKYNERTHRVHRSPSTYQRESPTAKSGKSKANRKAKSKETTSDSSPSNLLTLPASATLGELANGRRVTRAGAIAILLGANRANPNGVD